MVEKDQPERSNGLSPLAAKSFCFSSPLHLLHLFALTLVQWISNDLWFLTGQDDNLTNFNFKLYCEDHVSFFLSFFLSNIFDFELLKC